MYRPHHGARAVRLDVQAPEITFQAGGGEQQIFSVAGSASTKGDHLTLTLVNTHATERIELPIDLRNRKARDVTQTVLTHKELNAHNTFDNPHEVRPNTSETRFDVNHLSVLLEPASITRLDVRLAG
jgi:alpha-N-arabinofuranosidase